MAGFINRWTRFPTVEELTAIEAVNIVDNEPPSPTTGVGSGTALVVGEFEDGPFAVTGNDSPYWDGDAKGTGVQEVFSSQDYVARFGSFGFQYGSVVSNNPCARRHLSEYWNGNGYLKIKYLTPRRLMVARVNTSVGRVAFSSIATIEGGAGPFNLEPTQQLTVTTDQGGPALSTAITAVKATAAGAAGTFPTLFGGGEQIGVTIDSSAEVIVTFSAADQTNAQVVSRINSALGFTSAVLNTGQVDIAGIVRGTSGRVVLRDVTAGTLATLGHTAGTDAGTGSVGNVDAVTAAEVAAIINGTAALTAIDVVASVSAAGTLRVGSTTAAVGTVLIAAGAMATALGFATIGSAVAAGVHAAGFIPAGTRVRTAGGAEWVTLQTLTIPEGTSASLVGGPYVVDVRPATDNGLATGTALNTVVVVVDQPSFGALVVTNPAALTSALDEPAMDVAYGAAIDATLGPSTVVREVNQILAARQSDAVRAKLKSNAITASKTGHFGRKATLRAPIGYSQTQALAQVQTYQAGLPLDISRINYCWPNWQAYYPEIAIRGTAGGEGFTANGVISVGSDGPLVSINCQLPPEENPGQPTGMINDFFTLEPLASPLQQAAYISLKAAGICAPRVDRVSGSIYQSGITACLTTGLKNQSRQKLADFIGDSLADRLVPYIKRLNTQNRRDAVRGIVEQFLSELQSANNPEVSRIDSFSVSESANTAALEARGIYILQILVRSYSSLDAIVLNMTVGEGVVTVAQAA